MSRPQWPIAHLQLALLMEQLRAQGRQPEGRLACWERAHGSWQPEDREELLGRWNEDHVAY